MLYFWASGLMSILISQRPQRCNTFVWCSVAHAASMKDAGAAVVASDFDGRGIGRRVWGESIRMRRFRCVIFGVRI